MRVFASACTASLPARVYLSLPQAKELLVRRVVEEEQHFFAGEEVRHATDGEAGITDDATLQRELQVDPAVP